MILNHRGVEAVLGILQARESKPRSPAHCSRATAGNDALHALHGSNSSKATSFPKSGSEPRKASLACLALCGSMLQRSLLGSGPSVASVTLLPTPICSSQTCATTKHQPVRLKMSVQHLARDLEENGRADIDWPEPRILLPLWPEPARTGL